MTDFLQELNDSQRQAVEYIDGPALVIAGAGSGKTRVLTYKIAYLLTQDYKPWEIMALTFTNKAAKEMRERIARLVGDSAKYLRMGTFHSVFAQILRAEASQIGYEPNFTIYDESDSRSLCKAIVKELGLDDKTYKPADVHGRISWAKNKLMSADEYMQNPEIMAQNRDSKMPHMGKVFEIYCQRCRQSNAMDFDDLLVNTFRLLNEHDDVRMKYQMLFQYILVDEYQDTNYAQQQIIMLLAEGHKHVCVVGDDAQSIYAFRGANIDNILDFQTQYGGAKLFKLEQNYRSTQRIVEAANGLIHKNSRQIEKQVYSRNAEGEPLKFARLSSDKEEALFVCRDIRRRMKEEGLKYSDFSILYRTNAQSRPFEDQMLKEGMPYRIHGGMSFYQRKEIKDIVAYLRLIANPDDEEALRRIINYPARGIGDTTVNRLMAEARSCGIGIWDVIADIENPAVAADVNKGAKCKIAAFRNMIYGFMELLTTKDAYELGDMVVKQSGISQDLYSSREPEYLSKQENMEEFITSMHDFVEDAREEGNPTGLLDFLHEVALLSDREKETDTPQVTLMTVHSAKGLEFPCVYVVGMEENIFPSMMSIDSTRQIEEERRLLYVAITRAERYCTLTCAQMRFRYGKMEIQTPSRFLRDVAGYLKPAAATGSVPATKQKLVPTMRSSMPPRPQMAMPERRMRPVSAVAAGRSSQPAGNAQMAGGIMVGAKVAHDRFGQGVVTAIDGSGDSAKATVEFVNAGTKQLLLKFAKLRMI